MTILLEGLPGSSLWLMLAGKMTALLAAAWMAHWLLLGRNPRWRVMLWRGVMVGLVVLPALEVLLPALRVEVPSPAPRVRYVVTEEPGDAFAGDRRPYGAVRPEAYVPAAVRAPSLLERAGEHWAMLLAASWGLIAAVLGLRTVGMLLRVQRIIREAVPAPQRLVSRMEQVAEDLRCHRRVGLRVTGALVSPFLTRIWRPLILLPEQMAGDPRSEELTGILAHELAHVRSNDLAWLLCGRGLSCLLWFHPLTWRMAAAHAAACEEVSDAVAAEYVGGAPAYTGMLARVALQLMADAPADGGVGMVRAAGILQRVRRLQRGIRAARLAKGSIITAAAGGCLALLVLGSLKIAYADKSQAESAGSPPGGSVLSNERKPVVASTRRDGKRVWVEGLVSSGMPSGKITDAQLRGMEILLKHRGEKADPQELMVLSGDAFNLCHAKHWQGGLSQLLIATDPLTNVAKAYGYSSRWLNANLLFGQINRLPAEQKRQKLDELHQAVGRQLEAGEPVLMGGAYGLCGAWRVVAGYDPDKQQLCYVGGEKPYDWVDIQKDPKVAEFGFWDEQVRGTIREGLLGGWQSNVAFLLEEKTRTPSAKDRLVDVLTLAVDLFEGREHAFWDNPPHYLGRRAYLEWSRELGELDYPADRATADPKATFPWYSIDSMALEVDSIIRGRAAVAKYLESGAGISAKMAPHLQAAATHYRNEVAVAKETFAALLGDDQDARQAWLADKAKREAAAKAVRRMMSQEEAAVADIGKALAAEGVQVTVTVAVAAKGLASKAKVVCEDGKVWIEGMEHLVWPEGSENTTLRSLAAALQAAGQDVTFEQMMGISGAAFRMQVSKDGVCPSSPHAFCGFNCMIPALVALGYEAVPYEYTQDDADGVAVARSAIIESIDRGWPVLFGSEESGLVVGYADKGQVLLVRPAYAQGPGFQEWKGWPWGFHVLQRKGKPLDPRQTATESLKRAVYLAGSSEFGKYAAGFAAYDQWISYLEAGKNFEDVAPKQLEGTLLGNAFIYACLIDARTCAGKYLQSIQGQFGPEAAAHVSKAADLYGRIAAKLQTGRQHTRFPWQVAKDGPQTPEMRKAQVVVLKEARDLERQAVAELKAAIEVVGTGAATKT